MKFKLSLAFVVLFFVMSVVTIGCLRKNNPVSPSLTATPTITGTPTKTGTPTNSRTNTASPTVTNTRTNTYSPTITNTATETATNSITETPTDTSTPTASGTPTNTATTTPTTFPAGSVNYNSFDIQAFASTGAPAGYLVNTFNGGGGTMAVSVVNNYYYSSPNSLQVTATGVTVNGVLENLFESPNWGTPESISTPLGSTMKLSVMLYANAPITIANAYIWDATPNKFMYSGVGASVPSGAWTNVLIPVGTKLDTVGGVAPWTETSGSAVMDWTHVNAVGFDIIAGAGSVIFYYDDIYFLTN
jgi:hypothetical protein